MNAPLKKSNKSEKRYKVNRTKIQEKGEVIQVRLLQPHHTIHSRLEQIVRVENPLKMSTQVRANCFSGSKAHLHCNLSPSSLLADHFKATLLLDQLYRNKCRGVNSHKNTFTSAFDSKGLQ